MNINNGVTERIKERCIIIYDESTKAVALSLRNSITKTNETCVVWTEKVYNDNEFKLTNHNLLVLLNEKMIITHLANPAVKTIPFSEYVILKHEGNTLGLIFNPRLYITLSGQKNGLEDPINVLKTMLQSLFLQEETSEKNLKEIFLFKAIEKFKEGTLEKFLRGEELD